MTYKAKVDDSIEIEMSKEEISNLDAIETSKSKFHILQNNKTHSAEIIESDFYNKTYKISVNNKTYNVVIEDDLDALISKMGFTSGSKKQVNAIHAPMPGLILDIPVEVGQPVKENETLFILEAMKMENSLTSPIDGLIKAINVKKGDAVEKNQLLIEFE